MNVTSEFRDSPELNHFFSKAIVREWRELFWLSASCCMKVLPTSYSLPVSWMWRLWRQLLSVTAWPANAKSYFLFSSDVNSKSILSDWRW